MKSTSQIRSEDFPQLVGLGPTEGHRYHYFNYGGQGLLPTRCLDSLHQCQTHLQSIAPFSNAAYAWTTQITKDLRQTISQALKINPDELTLTENTTAGCNIALWGLDWHAGDHILLTDCEHQGIQGIVNEVVHRFDLTQSTCAVLDTLNTGDPIAVIRDGIKPQTRLLVISHILWTTGQVLPLQEIVQLCHDRGVQVLVDGAQSVGVLPLDLGAIGADFYAFTVHKWWCGPQGIGGLHVRSDQREALRPTTIGWRSVTTDVNGNASGWESGGKRYEVSTTGFYAFPAATMAIELHDQVGTDAERYQMICDRAAYLWNGLSQIPGVKMVKSSPPESGLVAFQLDSAKHRQLVEALETKNHFVRLLANPHCVRACTHYFTSEADCDSLCQEVAGAIG
jgi:L-cysteine/cystine lyase